jgi:hypothetical protein
MQRSNLMASAAGANGVFVRITIIIAATAFILSGCAGLRATREPPRDSAQAPEEAGALSVGRVLASETIHFSRDRPLSSAGVAGAMGAAGPLALPVLAAANFVRNADWSYRYSLRMKSGGERTIESDFVFAPGECVALRAGLSDGSASLVKALPGECD